MYQLLRHFSQFNIQYRNDEHMAAVCNISNYKTSKLVAMINSHRVRIEQRKHLTVIAVLLLKIYRARQSGFLIQRMITSVSKFDCSTFNLLSKQIHLNLIGYHGYDESVCYAMSMVRCSSKNFPCS